MWAKPGVSYRMLVLASWSLTHNCSSLNIQQLVLKLVQLAKDTVKRTGTRHGVRPEKTKRKCLVDQRWWGWGANRR